MKRLFKAYQNKTLTGPFRRNNWPHIDTITYYVQVAKLRKHIPGDLIAYKFSETTGCIAATDCTLEELQQWEQWDDILVLMPADTGIIQDMKPAPVAKPKPKPKGPSALELQRKQNLETLQRLLDSGYNQAEAARIMGKTPGTISVMKKKYLTT